MHSTLVVCVCVWFVKEADSNQDGKSAILRNTAFFLSDSQTEERSVMEKGLAIK